MKFLLFGEILISVKLDIPFPNPSSSSIKVSGIVILLIAEFRNKEGIDFILELFEKTTLPRF